LIPSSLDKIAKDFGIKGKPKGDDIDIVNVTLDELFNDEKYVKYNKQDCKLLQQILGMYKAQCIKAFNIDPLTIHPHRLTANVYSTASITTLLNTRYTLPENVRSFVNKSYGGARCEVFYRGLYEQALNYHDINSSYPHAGCSLLPYGKPKYLENLRHVSNLHKFLSMHPGFYEVKIKKCGLGKPIHGIMHEGKYIFPRFDSNSPSIVLFSEEIKYGLSLGWDYQLLNGYEFKLGRWGKDLFQRMYDEKLKAKKDNNKALEYAYKITANSSYGFFGYNKYNRHVTKVYETASFVALIRPYSLEPGLLQLAKGRTKSIQVVEDTLTYPVAVFLSEAVKWIIAEETSYLDASEKWKRYKQSRMHAQGRSSAGLLFEDQFHEYASAGQDIEIGFELFGGHEGFTVRFDSSKHFRPSELDGFSDKVFQVGRSFYPKSPNWASLDSFGICQQGDEVWFIGFQVTLSSSHDIGATNLRNLQRIMTRVFRGRTVRYFLIFVNDSSNTARHRTQGRQEIKGDRNTELSNLFEQDAVLIHAQTIFALQKSDESDQLSVEDFMFPSIRRFS